MIIFAMIEFFLIISVLIFGVTQVVIPLMKNQKMFPMFGNIGKMEKKEAELNQLEVEKKMKQQLDKREMEILKNDE